MGKKMKPGEKYGRYTCVRYDHTEPKWGRARYLFRCDCGNERILYGRTVKGGHTKSCGCYQRELASKKRTPLGHAEMSQIFRNYKVQAKIRKLEFSLSRDFVESLTKQNCHYCGVEPSNKMKVGRPLARITNIELYYSGLDRIDNTIGYIKDNVVPCCKMCNQAKHHNTLEEFKEWIMRAAAHLQT